MKPRVLWVDDEESLILSMKRQLHSDFDITAAFSGDAGLDAIGKNEPFSVIVSDQRMPGMDGIEFLSLAKDLSPDSVRIMLTGYAEQDTAIEAVNQGQIFRFLTKPCPPHIVLRSLRDAVRQYELITAERELLEKTLTGSIEVMVDILALANPIAFRRASSVAGYASDIARIMKVSEVWQVKAAAMLSHMGYITLPAQVLENFYTSSHLSDADEGMLRAQIDNTAKLLDKIPRLGSVQRIIREMVSSRNTTMVKAGDPVALAASILHTAIEYDRMIVRGVSRPEAIHFLSVHDAEFNRDVIEALTALKPQDVPVNRQIVMIDSLKNGMIVDDDVVTVDGMLLVPKGYVINDTVRQRLRNFHLHGEIESTIPVLCE